MNYHFLDHFTLGLNWLFYDRLYADFNPVNRHDPEDHEQSYRIPSYHLMDGHFKINFKMFGQEAIAHVSMLNILGSKHIIRGLDGADHSPDSFTGFWGFGRTMNVGLNIRF